MTGYRPQMCWGRRSPVLMMLALLGYSAMSSCAPLLSTDSIDNGCVLHKRHTHFYVTEFSCNPFESDNRIIPDSVDWRVSGAVSPIKNQGQCGSCWAFSATGALEGAIAVETGKQVSLSEQELVDCVSKDHGCDGGAMDDAFEYVREYGICTETEEPYLAKDSECVPCNSQIKFNSCVDIEVGNQFNLKEAVSRTPVSVAIQADNPVFRSYSGGIISDRSCGTHLNHGVLIVGYGEEKGLKYWIVKNSWGSSWGENGYVRIARNDSASDAGVCGIAMQASYPSIQ